MSVKGREGFPGGSDSNEFVCNAEDLVLIPRLGRSSGEGNGKPLQYSCLENSMDRGGWRATVHGVAKSWTRQAGVFFFVPALNIYLLLIEVESMT